MLRTLLSSNHGRPCRVCSRLARSTPATLQLSRVALISRLQSTAVRLKPALRRDHSHLNPSSRCFSSSSTREPPDASPTSFADPDRPELFYHLFRPPQTDRAVFALSFLPETPHVADSCVVLGWLPAHVEGGGEAGLNDFRENGELVILSRI